MERTQRLARINALVSPAGPLNLFSSVGYISLRRKPSIHAASGVFSQTAPQFHLGEA
jgi:hypothetical protein